MATKKSSDARCDSHFFTPSEVTQCRQALLAWYDDNQRTLPWRTIAKSERDLNIRGYAVWVSEIMLQQTQVATVIDYYKRWMAKWPDLSALSQASLDEVNEMWSGLGYYSRGRRLREGALKVVENLGGQIPSTSQELMKQLPGVGRYTAAAIGSIAFGEPIGLVDGNVVRVLSRMRKIGAESTAQSTIESHWTNANNLVDESRPGDFNQAVMELGATVCTPKNPNCNQCPVADLCLAFADVQRSKDENTSKLANRVKKEIKDIEDISVKSDCSLCLPKGALIGEVGVQNYPRKGPKNKVRSETSLVCIVTRTIQPGDEIQYLMFQRPKTGLLANLLEFPSFPHQDSNDKLTKKYVTESLKMHLPDTKVEEVKDLDSVGHQFSHIKQTYRVWSCSIKTGTDSTVQLDEGKYQRYQWLNQEELLSSPISTAMKKVFQSLNKSSKRTRDSPVKGQRRIESFFGKRSKHV
ncbi:hypothetical protein TCAL_02406 [Tigriopus californicus]|uniref:Adenine DNA glycosylase n=1 Tax=Tigriopus californicus TaxID=6832 RepID=A0A553P044_TIGCA|nr:adenine DNA glycosylase-like [Tigriopus californicus]TRY71055.1 hypothetical protein TCAL_02406 [Tigriopus californicus]|eukprot:TCALIF_02406-PA protein Name:"Similar to Mutyh A/G-specific adenine DNA glycosylase (Mus musculus)" AED:0.03 eAED:0.03 QI:0/0/0/1/1/1/3/0/465